MQARYYDPVIGRFYSNDPIGFLDVHSFNRYAYANNNPYKYTDPTGMSSVKGACPSYYACLDSSESSSIQDSAGWQKTGVTDNGIDRYSFVRDDNSTDKINNGVAIASFALGFMEHSKLCAAGTSTLAYYRYSTGEISGRKAYWDTSMAVVGLFWPVGTAASLAYFMVDLTNGGDWPTRPSDKY